MTASVSKPERLPAVASQGYPSVLRTISSRKWTLSRAGLMFREGQVEESEDRVRKSVSRDGVEEAGCKVISSIY